MRRTGIGLVVFPLILLGLIGGMVVVAFGFSEEARRLPIVIGVPVGALLALQVVREEVRRRRGDAVEEHSGVVPRQTLEVLAASEAVLHPDQPSAKTPSIEGGKAAEGLANWRGGTTPIRALLWIGIFALCVFLLGVMVTAFVFPPLFMLTQGGERWRSTLIVTLVTVGMTYFGFVLLLGVRIYPGWLFA